MSNNYVCREQLEYNNYNNLVENMMEHIDEIIVIFDKDGFIRRMNSISDQILPFKRKDIVGKNIRELVKDNLVDNPIILEMIETKKKVFRDIIYPEGKVVSYTAIPRFSINGDFMGGVLTGRDISRILNLMKASCETKDSDIEYISESKCIERIKDIIATISDSDASVLILGESGTGKEIIARSVWKQSCRRDKPFVAINCASISQDLVESELFGYEAGAFTGARKEGKKGLLEHADGGTIFLDEIGELSLETQKKLLRVIQEKSIIRIGGVEPIDIDVRFISATNKTTKEIKDPNIFRQDLYYRLSVIPILIPPLRHRKEDILPITDFYIERFNNKYNRNVHLTKDAKDSLVKNDWRGNIRELKNTIERLVILSAYETINKDQINRIMGIEYLDALPGQETRNDYDDNSINREEDLEKKSIKVNDIVTIDEAHRIVEQEIISMAIKKYGNVTEASKAIGINPSTVYRKIKSGYIDV